MNASVHSYSAEPKSAGHSRLAPVLRRVPLVMVTIIFTLISLRYLSDPMRAGAAMGLSFTSPGGITAARIGFAGFPLAFAILAAICLASTRRLLAGLYMVMTVDAVIIAVRIFGIVLDHSASESARLLIPEFVLLSLSVIAIRLELATRHQRRLAK
jgi:hypothetical protein